MKWLITGITGFIGGVLLKDLIRDVKNQPRVSYILLIRDGAKLSRLLNGSSLPPQFEVVEGDLHHLDGLQPHLASLSGVLHIAGLINGKREEDFQYTNVQGTQWLHQQVMQASGGRCVKWIQISSIAANGPVQMTAEERRPDVDQNHPVSWYGQSKLDADNYLRHSHPSEDLIIVRPPPVFGKEDRAWIAVMKLIKKRVVPMWVGSTPYFSFIDGDLLAQALRVLMTWTQPISESIYPTYHQPAHWNQVVTLARAALSKKGWYLPLPLSFGMLRTASKAVDWVSNIPGVGRVFPITGDKIRLAACGHLVKDGGQQLTRLGLEVPNDMTAPWKECISYWQSSGVI